VLGSLSVLAACALALPSVALAHARLVRSVPPDGTVLTRAPSAVRVVFDDVVHPARGIEAVRNVDRASVRAGDASVVGGRTLVIRLRPGLGTGAYSVRWAIVSDDGHTESGVLAFAVGAGRPRPTSVLAPEATGPAAADVVARWLFFAGVLSAVGIAFDAFVTRSRDDERIALVLSTGAVLAAIGAGEEAHRVGLDTRAGTALGAGFLAALVVASLGAAATLEPRALRPALLLAPGLAVVPAVAGHALDPRLNRLNVVADVLHVAAAAAWVGALVGLLVVRRTPHRRSAALAMGGVVVLAVTGVVRASFELLHVSQLWDTAYGRTLLVKTGILLAAVGLGWLVRAQIRRRAATELALVAGLLVAVSVLVLLRPGRNLP
jgi:copper transport protein